MNSSKLYDILKSNYKTYLRNYAFLITGLFLISYGIALSVRSDLGTSPLTTIPYVLSFEFPISLGIITILFNLALLALQIIILRRNFPRKQILQAVIVIIFGYFIDFALSLTTQFIPTNLTQQWILCMASCFTIALGVLFEVNSNAVLLCADGLLLAINLVTDIEYGKLKTIFDTVNVIIGVILSFIFFSSLVGINWGTIVSAVIVGYIVRFYRMIVIKVLNKYSNKEITLK